MFPGGVLAVNVGLCTILQALSLCAPMKKPPRWITLEGFV
jgi:hypothetical protein